MAFVTGKPVEKTVEMSCCAVKKEEKTPNKEDADDALSEVSTVAEVESAEEEHQASKTTCCRRKGVNTQPHVKAC